MSTQTVRLTAEFKKQTTRVVIVILLFVLVYLILIALAVGLTAASIAGGIFIILASPAFITLVLGVGMASLGSLILIFLLKFLFTSNKYDRSHLIEVTRAEEPALFDMIDDIVEQVKTAKPKKVYWSADVNAAVFYDSSFWSMFLPIRKNLIIGIGLLNTLTAEELKAVLSHEFGHFSQRTMKVGSYVYNVNKVIFNMLYDNDSFGSMASRWGSVSGYIAIFVMLAFHIINGIQYLLRKMYELVNKSYSSLSREMEFHADEIAASITGYEPLKTALMRFSISSASYNEVLNYYNEKASQNIKSENIYADQTLVLKFLAEINKIRVENDLPNVTEEEQNRFNKSRLVIKDQWASHPTTKDRVTRLENTGFHASGLQHQPAKTLLRNAGNTYKQVTANLFSNVTYKGNTSFESPETLITAYREKFESNAFPAIFNSYYDDKNIEVFNPGEVTPSTETILMEELYSDKAVESVYAEIGLASDINVLKDIGNGFTQVKSFDFDGIRYSRKKALTLVDDLKPELDKLTAENKAHDIRIYATFISLEQKLGLAPKLQTMYQTLFDYAADLERKLQIYSHLASKLEFVSVQTSHEEIDRRLALVRPLEDKLKTEINKILSDTFYQSEITEDMMKNMQSFTSRHIEYFLLGNYVEENLSLLYKAMNNYRYLVLRAYFILKRNILLYQAELHQKTVA